MNLPKCIVYVLKDGHTPPLYYTGVTSNLAARLEEHNQSGNVHTRRGRNWTVDLVIEFSDERRALAFEKYLKSGSGCAFAKRHLR